jgi:hypothetical protein
MLTMPGRWDGEGISTAEVIFVKHLEKFGFQVR